jgi:hypothetical protein
MSFCKSTRYYLFNGIREFLVRCTQAEKKGAEDSCLPIIDKNMIRVLLEEEPPLIYSLSERKKTLFQDRI